jgi:ribosome-associated heat shock protein Hsp15
MAVEAASGTPVTQRLDKWLWCARVAKTRTQAAALVSSGKVRINRVKTDKPAHGVKIGDVITASVGPRVRVLAVKAIGERRGSADVARTLFEDLTAPASHGEGAKANAEANENGRDAGGGARQPGAGRPTKRDRRLIDRLKGEF